MPVARPTETFARDIKPPRAHGTGLCEVVPNKRSRGRRNTGFLSFPSPNLVRRNLGRTQRDLLARGGVLLEMQIAAKTESEAKGAAET